MMNVLALVAVLLFQAGAASRPGVITGRVMTGDGTPAVKVRVAATPADATNTGSPDSALLGITETDEQGNYRLEGLAPGQYRVVAGLLEWLTYYPGAKESTGATAIQITPGVTRPGTNFTLQRPVSVRVRGRLVRLNPRATLPNQITLSTSGNGNYQQLNTSVAADGAFEFPRVTPGSYQMQMNPYVTGVTLPPVNVTDKDVEGIEVKIPLVTNVRGKIIVEDGAPVPRMNIAFISERGRLDAGASVDGSFSISATEGEHRLVVSNVPGGYALRSMSSGSTDLLRQPLKVGEAEITDLVLRFSGPPPEMLVRLRGKVVRPAGNTGPVPNKIQLSGTNLPNLEAVIAPDGSFEYPKLLPGAYSVNLQPRNTPMPPLSINLIRDMDAFEITLPREFEVSGSVVVEQDGPQPQFSIRTTNAVTSNGSGNVYAQNGTFKIVLTEGEHRFNFQGLSNGYSVKSAKSGAVNLLTDALKVTADSKPADVVVEIGVPNPVPWRKVSGRVVTAPGVPLQAGLQVTIQGGNLYKTIAVNPDGSFELGKIFPGTYTASVMSPQFLASASISVGDRDVTFDIPIPRQVIVNGRLVAEGGVPLPAVTFALRNVRGNSEATIPFSFKRTGEFRVMVPEGEYRFEANGVPSSFVVKSMTAGPTDLTKDTLKTGTSGPPEIVVTVAAGEATPWRKISGKIIGDVPAGAPLRVTITGSSILGSRDIAATSDRTFEFLQVLPGTYRLAVAVGIVLSPATEFRVENDVTDVELKAPRPLTVPGRLTVEGTRLSNLPSVNLEIQQLSSGNAVMVYVAENFRLSLGEGEYRLVVRTVPFGYEVKSLKYGSTDLLNEQLKITDPVSESIQLVLGVLPEARASGVKITGRVTGVFPSGNPQRLLLFPAEPKDPVYAAFPDNATGLQPDGSFQFERVPPGTYLARLITMPPSEAVRIVVEAKDVTGVELVSKGQVEVSGTVTFEGEGPPLELTRVTVRAVQDRQADPSRASEDESIFAGSVTFGARVAADGTFKLVVPSGNSRIQVGGPTGYGIKSVTQGSKDLRREPLVNDPAAGGTLEPIRIIVQPSTRPPAQPQQ